MENFEGLLMDLRLRGEYIALSYENDFVKSKPDFFFSRTASNKCFKFLRSPPPQKLVKLYEIS